MSTLTIHSNARDQYGKIVFILNIIDNVVYTTNGIYHITKLFPVK